MKKRARRSGRCLFLYLAGNNRLSREIHWMWPRRVSSDCLVGSEPMSAVSWLPSLAVVALVTANVGGCGSPVDGPRPEAAKVAQAPNGDGPAPDDPAAPVERKIIYTSQIEVLVAD